MKISKEFMRNLILYGVIGGTCAGVDILIFYLLNKQVGWLALPANVVSVNVGIGLSFILNRRFNFKVADKTFRRLVLFYAVGVTGLAMSSGILALGDRLAFDSLYVKMFSVLVVSLFQFALNKFATFRK